MRGHRKNSSELYTERDHFSWLRRTVATVSTWLALAGYTLFALIFTSAEDNLKTSRRVLTFLGSIFLILGYIGAVGAFFLTSNPAFRYDSVIYPFFLTSIGGLMEIVLNHSLHKRFPVGDAYIYPPLAVAIISTLFCGFFAFTSLKRLDRAKTMRMRMRPERETPQWETHSFAGNRDQDPGQAMELLAMNIPEDEAQRQQLLRLLIAKEQQTQQRGPSPDPSSTYRIDWMGDEDNTHLAVPQHARPRSGSAPSITNRWHISNLLGGAARRQPSTDDLKSQREERRREIERQSLQGPPTGFAGVGGSATWGASIRHA